MGLACGSTEVDAIVSASASASVSASPAGGFDLGSLDAGDLVLQDAGLCATDSVVLVNRYRFRLRSDGRCLDTGAPIQTGGLYTWVAGLRARCSGTRSLWQLVQSRVGTFEIRNAWFSYNLYIEHGSRAVGADAIIYPPSDFLNQQFVLSELDDGHVTIAPAYAPNRCLTNISDAAIELDDCEPGAPNQEWAIEPEQCP